VFDGSHADGNHYQSKNKQSGFKKFTKLLGNENIALWNQRAQHVLESGIKVLV
jgi:hypothetical protein